MVDPDLERSVSTLSGGNQQKVLLARGLVSRARVWLLDEPSVGLDVGARAEFFTILSRVVRGEIVSDEPEPRWVALVVAMSDYEDLAALADRVYLLRNGRVAGEFAASEISEELLLHAATFEAV